MTYEVRRYSRERAEVEILRHVPDVTARRIAERDAANGTAVTTIEPEVRASGRTVIR